MGPRSPPSANQEVKRLKTNEDFLLYFRSINHTNRCSEVGRSPLNKAKHKGIPKPRFYSWKPGTLQIQLPSSASAPSVMSSTMPKPRMGNTRPKIDKVAESEIHSNKELTSEFGEVTETLPLQAKATSSKKIRLYSQRRGELF